MLTLEAYMLGGIHEQTTDVLKTRAGPKANM